MKSSSLKITLFAITLLFFFQTLEAQSAWTKEKGQVFSQVSFSTIPSYSEIFSDNTYTTSREITDNTIQLYAEYGLTDKLTLIANIPIKAVKTGRVIDNPSIPLSITETSKTDLGNIQIGLRHQFYNEKYVLSGQLNIEANTSSFENASGIRTGYDAWTLTPTINIGRGYKDFFFQAFTGVDIRTNDYSSNFKLGGELGYTALRNLTLIGYFDIVSSFNNGDINLAQSNFETALYINNQEYSAIGFKGLYDVNKNFGFTLGYGGAISANNVAKQLALSAGLFFNFK